MATYQVGADGKAPKGLQVGDFVVTGGGTYIIDFVNADGTYKSSLYNGSSTTYNTNKNSYSTPAASSNNTGSKSSSSGQKTSSGSSTSGGTTSATKPTSSTWAGQGSSVSNPGQGTLGYDSSTGQFTRTLNGTTYYVNPGDEKYNSIKQEYVSTKGYDPTSVSGGATQQIMDTTVPQQETADTSEYIQNLQNMISQLQNQSYTPVNQDTAMADVLSYDEAYNLAKSIVEPQYTKTYQKTANNSAQNLERAGLYDSLYGQALGAQAQQNVSADMNASIGTLANELQGKSWEQAYNLYTAAVNENQYASNLESSNLNSAMSGTLNIVSTLLEQAKNNNDYALAAAELKLQQQLYVLEAQYTAGQITGQELDNQAKAIALKAQQTAGTSTGGVTYGDKDSGGNETASSNADYNAIERRIDAGSVSYNTVVAMIESAYNNGTLTQAGAEALMAEAQKLNK